MQIRDRIKELRRVKASELHPNPKNWRTHPKEQLDAIRGILAEVGFAGAELARELPDGSLQLIDGHARAEIAGEAEVPVLVLDVTEHEADKLLATFDPLGAMAKADTLKLEDLLRSIETSDQSLATMLTDLAEQHGIVEQEEKPTKLEPLKVLPPPAMTWVLVGIPTVRFGDIAHHIESIASLEQTIVETTSNDG